MFYKTKADKLENQSLKTPLKSIIYMAPEDLSEDSNLGQLFIIAEINSKEKKVPIILDQAIKEMSEYYYHSPTKNAEAALETTCQYFNENITDITNKNPKWIKEKFQVVIIAIQNNQLVLSHLGDIKTWLIRQGKMHDITLGENNKKNSSSKKLLSHLVSGQLENDDVIMATNGTIFDFFSHDKIKTTVAALAPTQACAFFKNTVLDYKIPIYFNTLIIKFAETKKSAEQTLASASVILSEDKQKTTLEFIEKKSIFWSLAYLLRKTAVNAASFIATLLKKLSIRKKQK